MYQKKGGFSLSTILFSFVFKIRIEYNNSQIYFNLTAKWLILGDEHYRLSYENYFLSF